MRLTKKYKEDYFVNQDNKELTKLDIDNDHNSSQVIRNKLGQLEDIEDELGIDLLTLFKVLDDGVYCKFSNGDIYWYYFSNTGYELVLSLPINGFVNNKVSSENEFYFKDYGKTLALTKEELE